MRRSASRGQNADIRAPVAIAVIVWLPTAGAVRVAVHAWRPLAGAWSVAATAAEVPIDTVTLAPSTTVPCTVMGEPVTNWALAAGEEMTRSATGAWTPPPHAAKRVKMPTVTSEKTMRMR